MRGQCACVYSVGSRAPRSTWSRHAGGCYATLDTLNRTTRHRHASLPSFRSVPLRSFRPPADRILHCQRTTDRPADDGAPRRARRMTGRDSRPGSCAHRRGVSHVAWPPLLTNNLINSAIRCLFWSFDWLKCTEWDAIFVEPGDNTPTRSDSGQTSCSTTGR